ncbi:MULTISPECIES: DUF4190 domain-containing protein [unclassified Nocardioides]|uniref:DUF4190 domain-containing protein n=1 Tax=unclassified Nocardioides TaxID=2615069 RepID=UPI00114F114B|nr:MULTISPECIES: DUF4190 domain-containing protein [unclassified Nocardioides]TQK71032.1 uncharacterized protein DUF4190 [Nocardioides sp. SLBN-35]WGX99582.1 DUF4190 domain-containing protein [Nocardioides sp. QY071]
MTTPPPENDPYQPYGQPSGQYGQPYGQPAQPYGQPVAPYGYPPTPTTNGLAIASLVVSIISLTACLGATGIVGAILGHIAKGQIRQRNDQGGGLATAGIIIGWIGFALFLLGVAAVIVLGVWAESSVDDCYTHSDGVYRCS